MERVKKIFKVAFSPITVMMIPHGKRKHFNFKIPLIVILALFISWAAAIGYSFFAAVSSAEYESMKTRLSFYTDQFDQLKVTMTALKKSEERFRALLSLDSPEEILKNVDTSDSGNIDMAVLRKQIKASMERVGEIRDYLRQKRDTFMATPEGFPLDGEISSPYGQRVDPLKKGIDFHSGIDLSAPPGTPINATADGIVSFAGWSGSSGLLVVLEHGFGYITYYAHSRKIVVKVGEQIRRGQIIAYVGSTGTSTGPHVHYEIWVNGKSVDPMKYAKGRV